MKCIGYDKDWFNFLYQTYPTFLKDEAARREERRAPVSKKKRTAVRRAKAGGQ